mmetsp:Transcript_2601/g.4930  ORF Transcript_2601/g.4930 Transcript_2601/m.4930 type:complete len:88 (+) Transcript_2601:1-264(+)|eukprot:CAMPEP_0172723172 /NCGR_PEP_ID=MMETSP1074-20121228/83153_1 /TAXON_ID=2916 /ORGANISM="Ceratium fusus, Strain PA161109" /LENGTH=87 /DNA_ID=CAMNT_0013549369 /DNA_START=12 /DNA_END=275 /DNA_ORIENTATION=-
MNFTFEYTLPLAQETLQAEPAALTNSAGDTGSSPAATASPEVAPHRQLTLRLQGNGLVVAPVPPADASAAKGNNQPTVVDDNSKSSD